MLDLDPSIRRNIKIINILLIIKFNFTQISNRQRLNDFP